ncbi:MAG: beta strand repeat-containing protein, partial [Mycobacteriales bacterium]
MNATAYTTIQAAVDAAGDGDEIFIASGTYRGSGSSAVVTVGRPLFLKGGFNRGTTGWNSQTAGGTIIDGQGAQQEIEIDGAIEIIAENLTLNNGGVRNDSGTLEAKNGGLTVGSGTSNGYFAVAADGTLTITGTHTFTDGTYWAGPGPTRLTGGTTTVTGSVTAENWAQSGGTLTGAGTFTIDQTLSWTGGTMSGSGTTQIDTAATVVLSGEGDKVLDTRRFENAGTLTWTGGRIVMEGTNAVVHNASMGVFQIAVDQALTTFGGSGQQFTNDGVVTKSTTAGATTVSSIAFNNSGQVQVQSGTVQLNGGGTSGGQFSVPAGAALEFGGGTHSLTATAVLNADGTVRFPGGTTTIAGTYAVSGTTVVNGGTVNFNTAATSAGVTVSSGILGGSATLTITGSLAWSGGTMSGSGITQIDAAAAVTLSGGGDKVLDTRWFENAGTLTWTGGRILMEGTNAVVHNASMGVFQIAVDQALTTFGGSGQQFTNDGVVTKSTTSGATTVSSIAFNNSGQVEVQTGTLQIGSGGTSTGTFALGATGVLNFSGGSYAFNPGTSFTGAGLMSLTGATATVSGTVVADNVALSSGTLTGAGTFTIDQTLSWTGGTMSGSGTT